MQVGPVHPVNVKQKCFGIFDAAAVKALLSADEKKRTNPRKQQERKRDENCFTFFVIVLRVFF